MKNREVSSKGVANDHTDVNRRNVLKAFGLAVFSGSAVSSFAEKKVKADEGHAYLIYATVNEMMRDRSLKDGMLVRTAGFHQPGDGGHAEYIIKAIKPAERPGVIILDSKLSAEIINVSAVNYQMFGAVCDGRNDDGVQIKSAHAYANKKNLAVVNLNGEYWIKETNGIEIMTNVQWGHSIFHIDEKFNSTKNNRFIVTSRKKPVTLELDQGIKSAILNQLKPGVTLVPELAPYKNSLLVISDDTDRIGVRSGIAYQGRVSKPREEFVFIEEHGRILGEVAWGFNNITKIAVYPADSNYLILDGGTFYLSGEGQSPARGGYYQMGFSVNRSRTIIRNQWVGLDNGKGDIAKAPRRGFYSFNFVYDVLLEHVRLVPWEKNRAGSESDVPQGTYGISGNYVLNATFRNVTAEGSPVHWGVFGTNLFKNFRVEQCALNRIDVHFYCWNLYIRDSQIGTNGITITGGGDLFIENTTCRSANFISFRRDYGAKWDGDIRIRNCRLAPVVLGETSILSLVADDFDYKYPIGYGRTIRVEDVVVDFSSVPASESTSWLMKISSFSQSTAGRRVFFPIHLEFRNIIVVGREKGVRLMYIHDPQLYKLAKSGKYNGVQIESNCKMIFEDIQLEKISVDPVKNRHISFVNKSGAHYLDEFALYPEIRIVRCNHISADLGGSIAEVFFDQCTVANLQAAVGGRMPGAMTFSNCKFDPLLQSDKIVFLLETELGTSFTNCIIYAPRKAGVVYPELTDLVGFITINKSVRFNHINTRLGNDILNYYKAKSVVLRDDFIGMLKSHSDMDF